VPFVDPVDPRSPNTEDPYQAIYNYRSTHMKRLIALTVVTLASQADRFTPHIGLFGEAGYDVVNGAATNFVQINFGLR
jgi:hypothetical protein